MRISREDGIYIHFLKHSAFVLDFFVRNKFELLDQLFDAFATVAFDDADDDVFAAAAAAQRFAEHAEGFADAWRIAEKQFKNPTRFLGRGSNFEPVFRFLGQG